MKEASFYFAEAGFAFLGISLIDVYMLAGIISIITSLVFGGIQLYFMIKNAKKDGVITDDERQQLVNKTNEILDDAAKKADNVINKNK